MLNICKPRKEVQNEKQIEKLKKKINLLEKKLQNWKTKCNYETIDPSRVYYIVLI